MVTILHHLRAELVNTHRFDLAMERSENSSVSPK